MAYMHHPQSGDVKKCGELTGDTEFLILIHVPASPTHGRACPIDVKASVRVRPGLAHLVGFPGTAGPDQVDWTDAVTWERRVSKAGDLVSHDKIPALPCTRPMAPLTSAPAPTPTRVVRVPACAPAPASTSAPGTGHTSAPAATTTHSASGGHGGGSCCPTPSTSGGSHAVRNIALVLFGIAALFLLANILVSKSSSAAPATTPAGHAQAVQPQAEQPKQPEGQPQPKVKTPVYPKVDPVSYTRSGVQAIIPDGCRPSMGGTVVCEGIFRNIGSANVTITFLAPRSENGQHHGWAAGNSGGITPIEFQKAHFSGKDELLSMYALTATIPVNSGARFTVEFQDQGDDNTSYTLDLAVEKDGQITYVEIPGVPVVRPVS